MLNFISLPVKFLALLNLILISPLVLAQDDYAVANAVTPKAIPDSVRATSFANDTIPVREIKKNIWSQSDKINYNQGERGLSMNIDLDQLRTTHKNSRVGSSRSKATELNLDLTVVIFAGSKVVCYDTKVSIAVGAHSLGLAFDGYEVHLRKSEPIGKLDLFNPYPNSQIKMVNDSHQEYYLHTGLTESGWILILTKGMKREESIFLSNNNPACIRD